MRYAITTAGLEQQTSDCLVVGVFQNKQLSVAAEQLDQLSHGAISQIIAKGDLTEILGTTLLLYGIPGITASRVLLVYCGEMAQFNLFNFRNVIHSVGCALKFSNIKQVTSYLCELPLQENDDFIKKIRLSMEIIEDCFYNFDQFKTQFDHLTEPLLPALNTCLFNLPVNAEIDVNQVESVIQHTTAVIAGIKLTKDLANLPANICTPTYMAEQANQLAAEMGLTIDIFDQANIEKIGMRSLLAVSQGSQQPPKFVTLVYQGGKKEQKPVVLIGKGVTFDSGGICIKPAAGMEEMKFDMAGAASVLGILKAIALLKLPINVVGLMPLTENLPSGNATKPGDIIKSLSGQTIEVINTDAEGRLILADALTYSERFNPEVVINMATLTGAIIVALGDKASGLMSNNQKITKELELASQQSYDRVWSLPLWDDFQEQIESNVADISNIGLGGAKSITAGCFLSRFAKNFAWAHLDIAGTAWITGKDKTATGRPVSLLVQFLLNRCK